MSKTRGDPDENESCVSFSQKAAGPPQQTGQCMKNEINLHTNDDHDEYEYKYGREEERANVSVVISILMNHAADVMRKIEIGISSIPLSHSLIHVDLLT